QRNVRGGDWRPHEVAVAALRDRPRSDVDTPLHVAHAAGDSRSATRRDRIRPVGVPAGSGCGTRPQPRNSRAGPPAARHTCRSLLACGAFGPSRAAIVEDDRADRDDGCPRACCVVDLRPDASAGTAASSGSHALHRCTTPTAAHSTAASAAAVKEPPCIAAEITYGPARSA